MYQMAKSAEVENLDKDSKVSGLWVEGNVLFYFFNKVIRLEKASMKMGQF